MAAEWENKAAEAQALIESARKNLREAWALVAVAHEERGWAYSDELAAKELAQQAMDRLSNWPELAGVAP